MSKEELREKIEKVLIEYFDIEKDCPEDTEKTKDCIACLPEACAKCASPKLLALIAEHTKGKDEAIQKVADWFDKQAGIDERKAKIERFITLKEAYIADAKNYRAMAADLKSVIG